MDTSDSQYADNKIKLVDEINLLTPVDFARVLFLYLRIEQEKGGIASQISPAYIRDCDGKRFYRKMKKYFDQMLNMFLRNGLDENDRHWIFKRVAKRLVYCPKNAREMATLNQIVIEETHSWMKAKKSTDIRKNLNAKFRLAIKKYLHLTYELGYNEPSLCAKELAKNHKIDKYIMSGDFPVLLLPFLPDVEKEIATAYENYPMKDSWEMLKGRYFNHKNDFSVLAIEIKNSFTRNIPNFSDYFDTIYSDTYYKLMLGKKKKAI